MTANEIKREQPSFEVRAESLKKRTKEFFSTYENPNGSEDRLEICLIREGYRAVLMAEEEINRQKAEIERLKDYPKCVYEYDGDITDYCLKTPCPNYKTVDAIKAEAVKEFAERLKEKFACLEYAIQTNRKTLPIERVKAEVNAVLQNGCSNVVDKTLKEMVGEG